MENNLTNNQVKKIKKLTRAWGAGKIWAKELQVGDTFHGAFGEAKIRYADESEIEIFGSAAYHELKTFKGVYTNDDGVIIKIEKFNI